jgi:hypothetical protein
MTMSLKGIRIQQFHANAKVGQDIITHLADEVGLSSELITIDMDDLREQEPEEEEASAKAAFSSFGNGADNTVFHFDMQMEMEPGSQLIYLKHKFRHMQDLHEQRESKFETTDAMKFATKMERDVIEKNAQVGYKLSYSSSPPSLLQSCLYHYAHTRTHT